MLKWRAIVTNKRAPSGHPSGRRMQRLTAREQAFVRAFHGRARGNATQAAILAGYSKGPSARVTASRLLSKANVAAELQIRLEAREEEERAGAQERDRLLSAIARNIGEETFDRISAIKELNKVDGRHAIRHSSEGRVTLEQALMASRRPR